MKLILEEHQAQLAENWQDDHGSARPVVKFFDPCGAATWLIQSHNPENPDILFGLCDLGFGYPELGTVSLSELEALQLPYGLSIERDIFFEPTHSITSYARAARKAGRIVEDEEALAEAMALGDRATPATA